MVRKALCFEAFFMRFAVFAFSVLFLCLLWVVRPSPGSQFLFGRCAVSVLSVVFMRGFLRGLFRMLRIFLGCFSLGLFVFLFVCLFVFLFFCLFVCLFVGLLVCWFVGLLVCWLLVVGCWLLVVGCLLFVVCCSFVVVVVVVAHAGVCGTGQFIIFCASHDTLHGILTHIQTCAVTRVQSATEWTASALTSHFSKPVM